MDLLTTPSATEKASLNLAAGWYIALPSKKLDKKPVAVRLFEQELVAWRDETGKPVLMEEHCVHMGASLAGGKVVNGCIECPFHKWQFNSSGKCTVIPELAHIPQTARQMLYSNLIEENGYLWVWYGTPEPLFALPPFPKAAAQPYKYKSHSFSLVADVPARRVLENIYDGEHLKTLHDLQATSTSFTLKPGAEAHEFGGLFEAHTEKYVGLIGVVSKTMGLNFEKLEIVVESWTSGYNVVLYLDGDLKWTAMVSVTPVSAGQTIMHSLIKVRQTGQKALDLASYGLFSLQAVLSAKQDIPNWKGIKGEGRVFVKYDNPVLQYREFYQSWVERVS